MRQAAAGDGEGVGSAAVSAGSLHPEKAQSSASTRERDKKRFMVRVPFRSGTAGSVPPEFPLGADILAAEGHPVVEAEHARDKAFVVALLELLH